MVRGHAPPLRTTRGAAVARWRTLTGVALAIAVGGAGCGGAREAQPDEIEDEAPLDGGRLAAVRDAGDASVAVASARPEHAGFALGDNLLMAHRVDMKATGLAAQAGGNRHQDILRTHLRYIGAVMAIFNSPEAGGMK